MEADWTEKYRPTSLSEIYGNNKAVSSLLRWAREWEHGIPDRRGVILSGFPGIGKTSAALALANDMKWGVIELNASDVRNAERIKNIATRGALFETFTDKGEYIRAREGGRKLIILDEADNLYERVSAEKRTGVNGKDFSDRGGKSAILQTIKQTMQPIILIVNDLYALTRNTTLKKLCHVIRFQKIRVPTIEKALIGIIHSEGLEVEREALEIIAKRADGDLRAAINDLQALSKMGGRITHEMTENMGFRDNFITLHDALSKIFNGTNTDVRKTAWDLNETPDSLLTWLDENLPHAYRDPEDLVRGYEALSRADVYLGRVRRRQYYRLWAYANDMMTAGIALAKNSIYHHYTRYQFPSWILKMSRTKGMRRSRNELARKIGKMCHSSIKDSRLELLPVVRTLFRSSEDRNFDFAINMTDRLELSLEEIAFLLGTITEDPNVTLIQERATERHGERTGFYPSQMRTKKATKAGFDIKKKKKAVKKKKEGKGKTDQPEEVGKEAEGEKGTATVQKGHKGTGEAKEGQTEDQAGDEAGEDQLEGESRGVEEKEEAGEKEKGAGKPGDKKKIKKKSPEPRPEKPWF